MLEPYVMKVTRTVLRRGGESNLSNLSDIVFLFLLTIQLAYFSATCHFIVNCQL